MLLHGFTAVDEKHALYQGPECNEIGASHRLHHQPFALKSPHRT